MPFMVKVGCKLWSQGYGCTHSWTLKSLGFVGTDTTVTFNCETFSGTSDVYDVLLKRCMG
jgi:hypothetical protein